MKPQQVEEETLGASISPLLPQSSTRHNRKMSTPSRLSSRSGRENTPPPDPNVQIDRKISPSVLKKPPARMETPMRVMNRSDAPELRSLTKLSDSVKVVVRVRPVNSHEKLTDQIVQKISSDSVSVGGRIFTFDSAISSESTQEEVFQLVGVPLVQNSLAGFNTSVLSYGQTGSGKTYTMWGPLSAMVEEQSISSSHGIVPRIFHMLFSEIQKKQGNVHEKQINFQCRCSFLEIYNEQINDLLDPTHRNLQIRDDAKNGFYVENLTEEYVTSVSDVTQMLVKGLSNRKVGATSMNSKSSRSHVVFNCYIESWCKETSEKSFSSSRTSRISLIDLAGSEKDKLNGEGRHYINEGRHVKKSLSKLGELVNILAECTHSGQPQKIPYRDSCLTHLLQDSLGGNAKVTFICAISPDGRCRGGTLSTLRFGQRAKHITNNAVVNEITEDDVNELSDQIRQLKEELICEKSYRDNSACATSGYFKGHKARNSLNLLRVSLNRSLILPQVDDDSEEEVDVDEEDVTEFYAQLSNLHSSVEENLKHLSGCDKMLNATLSEGCSDTNKTGGQESIISQSCNHEHDGSLSSVEIESEDVLVDKSERKMSTNGTSGSMENPLVCQDSPRTVPEDEHHASFSTRLSIVPCRQSLVLEEPTLSVSPKINYITNKNMKLSSSHSAGENNASESPKRNSGIVSIERRDQVCSSLQSSKFSPTDSLAASLRRGMQIIEDHQRYSAAKKSLIGLSFEHLIPKPSQTSDKTEAGVQTVPDDRTSLSSSASPFLCASCKQMDIGCKPLQDNSNMQIVPLGEVETPEDHRNKGKSLEEAMKRVGQLEKVCAEQAAMIEKLHLVVQNSHGLEDNAVTQKNELIDDEHPSLSNDNNSEILRSESKMKGFKKEHDHGYKSDEAVFDISQREESLLQEIESLRNQLQSYVDVSSFQKQTSSQLMQTTNLRKNGDMDSTSLENKGQELEKERERWTESESRWISLTEELRLDLESNRRRAEKKEIELSQERKCSAELDDALHRAILGHARFVEHFAELQEKYNGLLEKHRKVMEGVAVVKKAAAKAGAKGAGSAFAEALAAELSVMRVEREKERAYLKEQNKGLRIQLRDTAEAVHAAGELLVRLREAEGAVSSVEEKYERAREETGKMRKQMEKLKKKHAMEMVTMKHYLAESRLPESALQPLFQNDSEGVQGTRAHIPDETEEWRSAFGPTYQ